MSKSCSHLAFALCLTAMLATVSASRAAPALAEPSPIAARTRSLYSLESAVISAGGAPGSSDTYRGNGSLGQSTPIGIGVNAAYVLYAGFWYATTLPASGTDVADPTPLVNRLDLNFPNPFNPRTTISFQLAQADEVRLEIFDLAGKRVRILVNEVRPPGSHLVVWDGKNDRGHGVASNLYLYRLRIGRFEATRKMLLLK